MSRQDVDYLRRQFEAVNSTIASQLSATNPHLVALVTKWDKADLVPGLSDLDYRIICDDDARPDDWIDMDHPPETLKALLSEVGRLYAPYLIANAKAVMAKADKMETVLDGQPWEQTPFTYLGGANISLTMGKHRGICFAWKHEREDNKCECH